ncbi:hypothetical protein BDW02DRAFT_231244 [Decorospora gaudefroyi]|uniref:Uncharacterized protein n=1 Tax=Decorospora gaudefroyi TaxID=184978 RepID=A0A6A5KV50_9PLEO|nr:hypothetical protein BDW02DRAFT_231244 [Decorospora gaudefroyi]
MPRGRAGGLGLSRVVRKLREGFGVPARESENLEARALVLLLGRLLLGVVDVGVSTMRAPGILCSTVGVGVSGVDGSALVPFGAGLAALGVGVLLSTNLIDDSVETVGRGMSSPVVAAILSCVDSGTAPWVTQGRTVN